MTRSGAWGILAGLLRRVVAGTLVTGVAGTVLAQQTGGPPQDPVSERIQHLVAQGDAMGARRVVDSVLASSGTAAAQYGEALYWRGTLMASPDSARRDLLRFVVDYPFSPRMEDALIRLAEGELRAGDRAAARRHLERMAHDHLMTDRGARAAGQLAELLFGDNAATQACDVLDSARARVSPGNVELTNQLAYSARPCEQVRIPTQPSGAGARRPEASDTLPSPAVSPPPRKGSAPSRRGMEWSVQVAAYGVRGDALRLAARLSARGYDARVTADKPYRVRIGRFADRTAAADVVARLKAERTTAIIVEAEHK